MKALTRGQRIDKDALQTFINSLELPEATKQQLLQLRPEDYIGHAITLAQSVKKDH
ncbi:MAG: hypothetical protein WD572_02020 [Gammaproteobacteria bacterium]